MIISPKNIKSLLVSLGARPEKALGQNFLIDVSVLVSVIEAASLTKEDTVLEIGPGLGVLTEDLLSSGASVYAIERDRKFIDYLVSRFGVKGQRFFLTQGDAVTLDWMRLLPEDMSWKLVSNLPYAISSYALRSALWAPRPASRVVVMLQREVAKRALALLSNKMEPSRASLLSLMVALSCSSGQIVRRVPASAFFPPPKVESAVLELIPMTHQERHERWRIDPEYIMQVAKQAFAHPRKQLFSSLDVRERAEELSVRLVVPVGVRPETLSADQWAELTRFLIPGPKQAKNHGDK